jgi:Na+/proline symporter
VTGNFRWLDVAVVAVHMAGMAAVGFRFSRGQTSTEQYFVAKRPARSWAMGYRCWPR